MAQGWFSECPLREGPPCAGGSGASPTALLELAPTPRTRCTTSQQNPPSREGKPPRNGPRGRDVTAGTSRHLPALGEPPPLLWLPGPGQGQGVRSAAGQPGLALTLLEDEDAVSGTVTPASSAHAASIRKGWHRRGTRQGSYWMCSRKSPSPSD